MTLILIRAAALIAVLLTTAAAHSQHFAIIVHPSAGVSALTRTEVSDYLLKRKRTWPNGKAVIPVDQPEKSAIRLDVVREIFGRSPGAIKSYWHQQIFSGRAVPPVEKANDDQVIAFVKSTPGAIGYVSPSASLDDLIVVVVRR